MINTLLTDGKPAASQSAADSATQPSPSATAASHDAEAAAAGV